MPYTISIRLVSNKIADRTLKATKHRFENEDHISDHPSSVFKTALVHEQGS